MEPASRRIAVPLSLIPKYAEAARFPPTSPLVYLVALVLVAAATALRLAIAPWIAGAQFVTLFPAVMLTTYLCGFRAGLAATGLAALAGGLILSGDHHLRDNVALAMFIAVALLDVVIVSALLRAYGSLSRAIDGLRQLNADLQTSQARFRDLLESAPDAMVIVDKSSRIVLINTATERLFGYPRAELLGQPIQRLVPDALRRRHQDLVDNFLRAPAGRAMGRGGDMNALAKDGSQFAVDVSLSPLHGSDEGLVCAVVRDVTARRAAEHHQTLLIHELNHRVKNTLATVQSIARQTLKTTSQPAAFCEAFNTRLAALSQAHDVLTRNDWTGASLAEVVAEQLRPYQRSDGDRLALAGPEVILKPRFAVALGMVFGELSTNAAKYGAFSREGGRVDVSWTWTPEPEGRSLAITWREIGGPPVQDPAHRGFGSRLIERSLAHELGGSASLSYPTSGLVCTLRFRP